jgi:hypothetical protein
LRHANSGIVQIVSRLATDHFEPDALGLTAEWNARFGEYLGGDPDSASTDRNMVANILTLDTTTHLRFGNRKKPEQNSLLTNGPYARMVTTDALLEYFSRNNGFGKYCGSAPGNTRWVLDKQSRLLYTQAKKISLCICLLLTPEESLTQVSQPDDTDIVQDPLYLRILSAGFRDLNISKSIFKRIAHTIEFVDASKQPDAVYSDVERIVDRYATILAYQHPLF